MKAILREELSESVEFVDRPEGAPVEETGTTLEENARLKAAALDLSPGEAAVAEDTGLEVGSLGGAPGVRSARFSGENATYAENVAKLLTVLEDKTDRHATFRTVAICRLPSGAEIVEEGVIEGEIVEAPRGDNGFGYDPVFAPAGGDGRTFAEMSPAEKRQLSHRGLALRSLAARLREQL